MRWQRYLLKFAAAAVLTVRFCMGDPVFDENSDRITNPLFPAPIGAVWTYTGKWNPVYAPDPYPTVSTTRVMGRETVGGIRAVKFVSGRTFSWFAQDTDGSVWQIRTQYSDGSVSSKREAIVPGNPIPGYKATVENGSILNGNFQSITYTVLATDVTVGKYTNCVSIEAKYFPFAGLQTYTGTYYAGVGLVKSVAAVNLLLWDGKSFPPPYGDFTRVMTAATGLGPDKTKPTITVKSPTNGARSTNSAVGVSGTARDNQRVDGVAIQVNGGGWMNATSTNDFTTWVGSAELTPGPNVVRICAVDSSGNRSATNQLSVTYVVTASVDFTLEGAGTFVPNLVTQRLEIGKTYSVTAVARTGFAFKNWSGSTNSTKATLTFQMRSNLTFRAKFADIAKPTLRITTPLQNARVTTGSISVGGAASDNVGVSEVFYRLNKGQWLPASTANGWTNWNAALNLQSGANLIEVYALDLATNASTFVSTTVTFTKPKFANIAPTVEILRAGDRLRLDWNSQDGWIVEGTSDFQTWAPLPSGEGSVEIPAAGPAQFFRLRKR